MTTPAAHSDAGARPAPRLRAVAGTAPRAPRGPDGRPDGVGPGAPLRRGEAELEAAEVRWRLTPMGEALVASLRAAAAAGNDRP
jgi:hypothetical protein